MAGLKENVWDGYWEDHETIDRWRSRLFWRKFWISMTRRFEMLEGFTKSFEVWFWVDENSEKMNLHLNAYPASSTEKTLDRNAAPA